MALLSAIAAPVSAKESERDDFDARPAAPASAQPPGARARDALRERLGRFGALSLDRRAGTLRSVGRLDGFLTGPSARDAATVALDYVGEHAHAFGLDGSDLEGLRLVDREFVGGIEHLAWEQRYRGVPAADAGLQAAVTGSGRLVSLTGPPAADLAVRSVEPSVGAARAYAAARASGGDPNPGAEVVRREGGAEQETRFADGGRASLTLYRAGGGHRLAWRVLAPVSSTGVYDVLVDARSGEAVRRVNRVKFAVPADVFRSNPATEAQQVAGADFAPWLTSSTRLEGPNAHAFSDVHDVVGDVGVSGFQVTPEAGSDVAPVAGGYQFPLLLVPTFNGDGCPAQTGPFPTSACSWDPRTAPTNPDPDGTSWTRNKQQSAAQLFYFVNTFHDHLRDAPGIGFVAGGFRANPGEPRGNPNTGAPATASDPVLAQTLDGADTAAGRPNDDHVNNANFLTLPDGTPGFMQMYLWKPPFGGYDGSNDAGMVFHEYAHGLTDRLVKDAAGFGALNSPQAGAMSEGFSDFYALDYLVDEDLLTDGAGADLRFGRYLDNATGTLVRNQSIDCVAPTTAPGCPDATGPAGAGAFTYADFGEITPGGPQVHDDGEIWGQTLWALRTALIAAHGEAAGVARAREYITGALRISPPEPSFLEMRNAILQSAPPAKGDDERLWTVFASRGMGYFAATDGGDDVDPVADFTDPADLTGTATVGGTVRDEDQLPVAGATVGVAGFDAGLGPQHSDVTAADGSYSFDVPTVPVGDTSTYPVVRARKAAFLGDRAELVEVEDGATTELDFRIERDWSSAAPGAGTGKVRVFAGPDNSSNGCGPGGLIDDDPGVVWGTDNVAGGRRIVVDLGAPIDVDRILIDPAAGCGDDASAALGQYRLEAATGPDGPFAVLPSPGTFTAADNGTLSSAFTGTAPRVRFLALHTLAPQDASPDGSGEDFVDVAELHVARQPGSAIGPTTETTGASSVGNTSATLGGTVTPRASAADVVFEYGTTTAYGATVSGGLVPAGSAPHAVSATAAGLAPGTTYHFRAIARRDGHDYPGADRTFTTEPAPPVPTPTPTPTATPTPTPTTPTTFAVGRKLTASRKGVFKVRISFGNRAPAGTARLRVLAGRRRLAEGRLAVRPQRIVTKTLTLNRRGRRTVRAGRSRKVTLELRLPDGSKVKKTIRLARRKR